MWTHEQQLQFPLPFVVMTDLSTESDRGTLWSTWLGNMLEDHPGQPSYHFVPYELGAFKQKYGSHMQSLPSHQKLFSGSLAAVKKTVPGISFLFLNSLHKGHHPKWMCSVLAWNHTEWARVHGKPTFFFFWLWKWYMHGIKHFYNNTEKA